MKKWYVYMVRCTDNSLYTGITIDVEKRIAAHNLGKGAKYTRSRSPIKLLRVEACSNESQARKREAEVKSWSKLKKEKLIKSTKKITL